MRIVASGLFLGVLMAASVGAQRTGEPFEARTFVGASRRVMPYRLYVPPPAARANRLPLVIYLHGASGVGTDNLQQISTGGNEISSRFWVRPEIQQRFPAFVAAPQKPPNEPWGSAQTEALAPYAQLVIELIDRLSGEFAIDRDRVYLVGQSMGGIGVWDLIAKRPEVFAAALPWCGNGDPKRIGAARHVKVWAFVGAEDAATFVQGTRAMVAALRAAGGTVKLTEYPKVGHDVWVHAVKEPELAPWLFAQSRR